MMNPRAAGRKYSLIYSSHCSRIASCLIIVNVNYFNLGSFKIISYIVMS